MTSSARPTRAEASDVANAVFDGADAIMLSGETAIGAHPVLAAEAAARIASRSEVGGTSLLPAGMAPSAATDVGALAYAAVTLATTDVSIEAIACYTRSGRTARILSALRPGVPIVAFSPDSHVAGRLALTHGVFARTCAPFGESSDRIGALDVLLREARTCLPRRRSCSSRQRERRDRRRTCSQFATSTLTSDRGRRSVGVAGSPTHEDRATLPDPARRPRGFAMASPCSWCVHASSRGISCRSSIIAS